MSKKRAKNRKNHPATTRDTSKTDFTKLIPIGIIIFVALGIGIAIMLCTLPKNTNQPTVSAEEQEMLKIQEASDYLKNKYGQDFIFQTQTIMYYVFSTQRDANVVYEQADNIFYVSTREMLRKAYREEDIDLYFDDGFCDSAYFVLNEKEIRQYFNRFIPEQFGTHNILLYFQSSVLPSNVSESTPFDELAQTYPDFLTCELYLLTDQDITQDDLKLLTESLATTGLSILLRINKIEAEYQKGRAVSEFAIGWNNNETSVMQAYINWPEDE